MKIGKDQKWPQRLRQAQAHTPRGMIELGRWRVCGNRTDIADVERKALALFEREPSCPGREWVRATADAAIMELSRMMGAPQPKTSVAELRAYDDWRDYVEPPHSLLPRRIWIGTENETGRLKLVHSPHVTIFKNFCPTYSRYGISWLEAWGWPDNLWSPSPKLNVLDRRLIDLWTRITEEVGFGARHGRVGWLGEDASLERIQEQLHVSGLIKSIFVKAG